MSSSHPRSRRLGAAVLSAVLAFSGLVLTAAPASATPSFDLQRLSGDDRFATANRIAVETFTDGATTALIAVWDDYADALAGNYLAGSVGGPVLLSQTETVPEGTLQTLQTLDVTNVTLLGGTAVLSEAVAEQLQDAGYVVDRQAGTNRYETAKAVAKAVPVAEIGEVETERSALLATGENFPDAVAGGPVSYAGNFPILLTAKGSLSTAASTAMSDLGIERVYILGGTGAVSDTVRAQVEAKGITTKRLAGADRFATAVEIAKFGVAELGFSKSHVNVATGAKFPDAITGGPHAGEDLAAIVLAGGTPKATCDYLGTLEATLTSGHIFGGTGVVSAAEEIALEECGGAPSQAEAGDYTGAGVERVLDGITAFTAEPAADSDGTDAEDRKFSYDSGDTFQLAGEAITLAQFESLLTGHVADGANGDVLDITYAPSAASTFNVTEDNVPAPSDATAVADDFDDDTERDDVIVSWSASPQDDVTYDVVRNDGFLVEPGTVVVEDVEGTTVTLLNEPDGTYAYSVTATSTTSGETSAEAESNSVTVPAGTAPSGGPQADNMVQTIAGTEAGDADGGDVWRIAFDAPLAPIERGDTITLVEGSDASRSGSEERTTVRHDLSKDPVEGSATFALSSTEQTINGVSYGPRQVLTVTLRRDAPVNAAVVGGNGNITYPLTVQISTGLTNPTGFPVDWATSVDRRVEADTAGPVATNTRGNDTDEDGQISDGDTITVLFNETMSTNATEPVADQITVTDGAQEVVLTHGGNATFTYSTPSPSTSNPNPTTNSLLTISDLTAGDTGVNYGAKAVIKAPRYVTDAAGHNWQLTGSDVIVNLTDSAAPEMASATGAANMLAADTITVTYSEAVTCDNSAEAAAQFTYDRSSADGDEFKPTSIDCSGNDASVVLTFADGVFQPGAGGDVVRYTEFSDSDPLRESDAEHAKHIKDLAGNDAVSPDDTTVSG